MNNTVCLDLNHMPQIPEADFSVLNSHVISAHCTGIETESLCSTLCVFVCHFLLSLVHKDADKWVWLSNLLRKSSNFKIVMHFGIAYLRSSHLCVKYRQMSFIVLFVCLTKPAALPWCTNESKHYINHLNLTHPQSWQIPSYIPLEVQVNTVWVLYPNTGLLTQKVIQLVLSDIAMQLLWLDCYISQFL